MRQRPLHEMPQSSMSEINAVCGFCYLVMGTPILKSELVCHSQAHRYSLAKFCIDTRVL